MWHSNFSAQVRALLDHPEIDVNRRNNDRLTSFMLAMQGGPLGMAARMGHQVRRTNFCLQCKSDVWTSSTWL